MNKGKEENIFRILLFILKIFEIEILNYFQKKISEVTKMKVILRRIKLFLRRERK